jgi:hypothetical protein
VTQLGLGSWSAGTDPDLDQSVGSPTESSRDRPNTVVEVSTDSESIAKSRSVKVEVAILLTATCLCAAAAGRRVLFANLDLVEELPEEVGESLRQPPRRLPVDRSGAVARIERWVCVVC